MRSTFGARLRLVALVIGAVLVLIGAAVFVSTESTRRVSSESRVLHELSEIHRLLEGQTADVSLAVHLAALTDQLGWELSDELGALEAAVIARIDELDGRYADHGIDEVGVMTRTTNRVLDLVADGEAVEAQQVLDEQFVPDATAAIDAVEAQRLVRLDRVIEADTVGARIGDLARLVVLLLVPMSIVIVYRVAAERQLRQRQLALQHEAEEALAEARDDFVAATVQARALASSSTSASGIPDEAMTRLRALTSEADDLPAILDDLVGASAVMTGRLGHPRIVSTTTEADHVVRPFVRAGDVIDRHVADVDVLIEPDVQRLVLRSLLAEASTLGATRTVLIGERIGDAYRWVVEHDALPDAVAPTSVLDADDPRREEHNGSSRDPISQRDPQPADVGREIARVVADAAGLQIATEFAFGRTRDVLVVPLASAPVDVPAPPPPEVRTAHLSQVPAGGNPRAGLP